MPTAFRQCYEAYTVYNFFKYLITFLEMHHGMSPTAVLVKVLNPLLQPLSRPMAPVSLFNVVLACPASLTRASRQWCIFSPFE